MTRLVLTLASLMLLVGCGRYCEREECDSMKIAPDGKVMCGHSTTVLEPC